MTFKIHNNKIHGITGPFSNILASAMIANQFEISIYNPSDIDLYIPRVEQRISKVQFKNAHHYEQDRVENTIDHLERINGNNISLNGMLYSIKYVENEIIELSGILLYVGNPTAIQLYKMRKLKLTVLVCCDSFLDYEFYDNCFTTNYSNESLKKTVCQGMINIMKPYTTDLYILDCNDTLSIDIFRLNALMEDENPKSTKKEVADF